MLIFLKDFRYIKSNSKNQKHQTRKKLDEHLYKSEIVKLNREKEGGEEIKNETFTKWKQNKSSDPKIWQRNQVGVFKPALPNNILKENKGKQNDDAIADHLRITLNARTYRLKSQAIDHAGKKKYT